MKEKSRSWRVGGGSFDRAIHAEYSQQGNTKIEIWKRFLWRIFYVGKGKGSRPYDHLHDALKVHTQQPINVDPPAASSDSSKKLDRILDIWGNSHGVVCLHVFHSIMPADAYTREAAIIEALSLRHLTNVVKGNFYGPAKSWPMKEQKYMGIALLYKAMQIYLAEGETQLSPSDIVPYDLIDAA